MFCNVPFHVFLYSIPDFLGIEKLCSVPFHSIPSFLTTPKHAHYIHIHFYNECLGDIVELIFWRINCIILNKLVITFL